MRNKGLRIFTSLLAVIICSTALAQTSPAEKTVRKMQRQQNAPKVTTEFGLGIGARYNWLSVQPISSNFTPTLTTKISYGAALQFRLNIGKYFGIQPEISYAYSTIKINDPTYNLSTKAKSNLVQVPLLLSFRIAMFRINAGPVFTLMDDTTYHLARVEDESVQQMHFGKLYPTVTYAAGVSVKFAKCIILDLRYSDQFCDIKSENAYIGTLDQTKQSEAQLFRTRNRSVQLRIGYAF